MSRGFVYLMLGLMGAIATVTLVQNLELRLPIRFLGFSSFPLPVGLAMLIFAGIGAVVAAGLNLLLLSSLKPRPEPRDNFAEEEPEVIDVEYID